LRALAHASSWEATRLQKKKSVSSAKSSETPRDGRQQARLARLLGSARIEVERLDDRRARACGQLCGVTGSRDIVDASVVICARAHAHSVATSDVADLRRLDRNLRLIAV
jgi:hypothetical protein